MPPPPPAWKTRPSDDLSLPPGLCFSSRPYMHLCVIFPVTQKAPGSREGMDRQLESGGWGRGRLRAGHGGPDWRDSDLYTQSHFQKAEEQRSSQKMKIKAADLTDVTGHTLFLIGEAGGEDGRVRLLGPGGAGAGAPGQQASPGAAVIVLQAKKPVIREGGAGRGCGRTHRGGWTQSLPPVRGPRRSLSRPDPRPRALGLQNQSRRISTKVGTGGETLQPLHHVTKLKI